ncbi:MAG: hypothetical protein BroJett011_33680 [Chloroflexota bacterium]|nr:MAG: hypothetical protein BroJett011_33680 [Chloroflexota bacterium]
MNTRTRIVNSLTTTVAGMVFLIGAGAFVLSYDALYATGQSNGIPTPKAWIWPLLVDGPLVVFTLALLIAQIMRQSIRLWAGLVILYTLATIGFNLSHAQSTPLGWTVAIVAPLGLLLTTEALRHLAKIIIERQAVVASLAELTAQVDSKVIEVGKLSDQVDSLTVQRDALKAEVEQLKLELKSSKIGLISPSVDEMNAARRVKKLEAMDTLLTYLSSNPLATMSEAGQAIGRSKTTVGNYIQELTTSGKLSQNGSGWEVSR